AQLTLTLYLIGMGACQLFYGPLSDRFGRRPVLIGGLVLYLVASLAAALAASIEILIAARLFQAIGGGAGLTLARAIVRDLYARERAASILGYITMFFALAPMVAPVIGGLLDGIFGWRASFFLLVIFGALMLWAVLLHLHETNPAPGRRGFRPLIDGYLFLIARPRFWAYAITLGASSGVFFSFLGGAPFLMVNVLGYEPVDYGLGFIVISLAFILGNFFAGRYSERAGIERMLALGVAATWLGPALGLLLIAIFPLAPWLVFLPMAIAAAGNGVANANCFAGAVSIDPNLAGTAAGLAGAMQIGLGAVTSQAVGLLQGTIAPAMFYVIFDSACVAAAVQIALNLHDRRATRAAP
ncbi:MAG: multidrug effflux MFS transporter, partial [Geminicoccales bacterium]